MAELPLCIPDANTALRWLLPDRDFAEQASDIMNDFTGGRVSLISPYHFPLEVGSGIRRQVATHKMTHQEGTRRFNRFLALRIPIANDEGLLETAFQNCQRFSISIRDSLYITLAQFYEIPLITADENLLRALDRFPYKMFLGDYTLPGVS